MRGTPRKGSILPSISANFLRAMHSAHALLQAASKEGSIENVIGPGSVRTFLGWEWVDAHPDVLPYIADLEAAQ